MCIIMCNIIQYEHIRIHCTIIIIIIKLSGIIYYNNTRGIPITSHKYYNILIICV